MKEVTLQVAASPDDIVPVQAGARDQAGPSFCPPGYVALEWLQHAPGIVAVLAGDELVFTHANDAYKRLVGRDDLVGLPFHIALPELVEQGVVILCKEVMRRGERYAEQARAIRVRNHHDGSLQFRFVDFVLQPIPGACDKAPAGLLVLGSDVTIETVSQRDVQFNLTHDALTALPNYVLFRDRLKYAVRSAGRAQRTLQVAAIDLDLFRRINALLGYEGGDRILQEAARRIEHAAGPEATVARETGDKFLVLLDAERSGSTSDWMQDVVAALSEPFDDTGRMVYVTCCVGGATFPVNGRTADCLLLAADRALARAKGIGPGMLCWDDTPLDDAELERFRLGMSLRDALAQGELGVHYEPQVDLVTGQICTVEASVRWTYLGQEVAPDTLVSVAEECGLIGVLSGWVLCNACIQAMQWREMGFVDLRVAVKLSARQFSMRNLEASIAHALSDSRLPAFCLDLELPEDVLMHDVESAVERLGALKRIGVRLTLDDFGAGFSSLAYLRKLPIDALKIDRSFLTRVPENDHAATIVNAIITMGHSLGMRVIAEGVERHAQCEYLSRHMCDEVHGQFLGKPLPADEMGALLRAGGGVTADLLRFDRAKPTLLLVDDEPSILSSLRRLLRNDGYQILTANSGQEGLQVLTENAVDVIMSDQRMPGMTGVEFLRTARQLYPDTVRIVLSGFTELQTVTDAVNAGAIYKFLTKPWDDEQLRGHIQEAFLYGAMANENRLLTLQVRTANQQLAGLNRQLETVLASQRREIERSEISLDIIHEALNNVPVPVLASDDAGIVVLANRAALGLFAAHVPILGCELNALLPGLPTPLPEGAAFSTDVQLSDSTMRADVRPMGNGSHSRGWLIAITGPMSESSPRRDLPTHGMPER